jgi:L-aspartate oxidase
MLAAARLVTAAALARTESRGGHWRSDFPQTQKTGTRTFTTLPDAVPAESLQQRIAKS